MSESLHVEKPFLDQLATLGWTIINQGQGFIPSDPVARLREGKQRGRESFRYALILPCGSQLAGNRWGRSLT